MICVQSVSFTYTHFRVNLALKSDIHINPPFSGKAHRLYESSSQQCHEVLYIN